MNNPLELFKNIHTLIFDVDGVFTDSKLLITEEGELLRSMNTRDGYVVKKAIKSGLDVVIITGGNSKGVTLRLQNLGVKDIYSNVSNKLDKYEEYLLLNGITSEEEEGILYMGDDIPDYEVMRRVGLPVCPKDAVPEIVNVSRYVSPINGGEGCVRDVIEKILKLQGKWMKEPTSLIGRASK